MEIGDVHLLPRSQGMAHNGICLDLSRRHGQIDAYATSVPVGAHGFDRFEYLTTWERMSQGHNQKPRLPREVILCARTTSGGMADSFCFIDRLNCCLAAVKAVVDVMPNAQDSQRPRAGGMLSDVCAMAS